MSKAVHLVFFTVAFCNFIKAQHNNMPYQKTHKLLGGVNFIKFTDEKITTQQLTGATFSAGYQLLAMGQKRKTALSIGYNSGIIENASAAIKQNKFVAELSDAVNILNSKYANSAAYWGYAVKTSPGYFFSNDKQTNVYSWFTTTSLSLYQSYHFYNNKQSVNFDIKIPLAGFVNRPQQKYEAKEGKDVNWVLGSIYDGAEFTALHNYTAADVTVTYQINFLKNWNLALEYNYLFEKFKTDNKLINKNQALKIGIGYNIR
jgi:hypothetical protein